MPRVVLFSAGMFFVNGLPSIVRGFAMSLLSKIVPAKLKRAAVTTGQMMFMIGRGVGASLAPLLTADTFPLLPDGVFLFNRSVPHVGVQALGRSQPRKLMSVTVCDGRNQCV